jgi:hypothetical protein
MYTFPFAALTIPISRMHLAHGLGTGEPGQKYKNLRIQAIAGIPLKIRDEEIIFLKERRNFQ